VTSVLLINPGSKLGMGEDGYHKWVEEKGHLLTMFTQHYNENFNFENHIFSLRYLRQLAQSVFQHLIQLENQKLDKNIKGRGSLLYFG